MSIIQLLNFKGPQSKTEALFTRRRRMIKPCANNHVVIFYIFARRHFQALEFCFEWQDLQIDYLICLEKTKCVTLLRRTGSKNFAPRDRFNFAQNGSKAFFWQIPASIVIIVLNQFCCSGCGTVVRCLPGGGQSRDRVPLLREKVELRNNQMLELKIILPIYPIPIIKCMF